MSSMPQAAAAVAAPRMIVLPQQIQKFGYAFSAKGSLHKGLSVLFYSSLVLFFLFLLLTFIHYTIYPVFSFSAEDDGIISIPTASDQQKAYTKIVAEPDMSANFVAVPNCSYTISFDTYLSGDFFVTKMPRVLLYRSNLPVKMQSENIDATAAILKYFPSTNMVAYLDQEKNDLIVAVITSDASTAAKKVFKLPAITNVPIRKVFRVTIVFTERFLEVYINGKLEQSMPIPQRPMEQTPDLYFYTTPAMFGDSVKVANMSFWPRPLRSRDVRANGEPIANDTLFSPTKS